MTKLHERLTAAFQPRAARCGAFCCARGYDNGVIDPGIDEIGFETSLERLRRARPSYFYEPHANGQAQFHAATQQTRSIFPGNRWGKTTAMAIEVQRCADNEGRVMIWVCPQFKQFDALRPQLEEQVFDRDAVYVHDDHYRWPNGSKMFVIPRERDWQFIQGINPDLVCIDEECPVSLWRELRARGAGLRNTRYIIAATATSGDLTWMASDIYEVWLKYHTERGCDEEQAMALQLHPDIWCWPRGGIADNSAMSPDKVAYFHGLTWGSEKERRVRQSGGFIQWVGDAVFPFDDLEWLRARRKAILDAMGGGREGALIVDTRPVPPRPERAMTPKWIVQQ